MTYDKTKHSRKKKYLQNYDFLYVWNANLFIYKENFLFVNISVKKLIEKKKIPLKMS